MQELLGALPIRHHLFVQVLHVQPTALLLEHLQVGLAAEEVADLLARARRAAKEDIPLDSDSGTSGLLSPRDKALRATLKKKEESKKEKAKAKKQNGAAAKE